MIESHWVRLNHPGISWILCGSARVRDQGFFPHVTVCVVKYWKPLVEKNWTKRGKYLETYMYWNRVQEILDM